MLSAYRAVAMRRRVGRSAVLLFNRHEFHAAFWAISWMIRYNFGMHRAGVFLFLLMIVLAGRAIRVNRPYLCAGAKRDCHRADENKNLFLHIELYLFCSGGRAGCGSLRKYRRHACRYGGRLANPKALRA